MQGGGEAATRGVRPRRWPVTQTFLRVEDKSRGTNKLVLVLAGGGQALVEHGAVAPGVGDQLVGVGGAGGRGHAGPHGLQGC